MENLKNFIGNVMVAGGSSSATANNSRSTANSIASVAEKSQQNSNGSAFNYGRAPLRNRTESESSNASISSSVDTPTHYGRPITQKDKDSYFWVMWHS